jgi:hypothetical protein
VTSFGIAGVAADAAYELGEPYSGAVLTTHLGICTSSVSRDWGAYYGTGAEIPDERFVAATIRWLPFDGGRRTVRTEEAEDGSSRVTIESKGDASLMMAWRSGALPPGTFALVGTGRLRVATTAGPQGLVVEALVGGDFFDTQVNAPCHPEPFADGERCVPRTLPKVALPTETCTIESDTRWAPLAERVE